MEKIKQYEPLWGEWFVDDKLGEGSCGIVYRINRKHQGNTYFAAVKMVTIPQSQQEIEQLKSDGLTDEQIKIYYQDLMNSLVVEIDLQYSFRGVSNIINIDDYRVVANPDGFTHDIMIKMELLTDLHTHLRNNQMTKSILIKMGIDLCRALELCHNQNVIHRDIKPENIFISKHGDFKLGDFGVARKIEKTFIGLSHKGTYVYMAPEVYKGEEYNISADIYSLGLVLYRILNMGKIPFLSGNKVLYKQKEAAIMRRMSGEALPYPISGTGPLEQLIMKACNYQRQDRYVSATVMRTALEELVLPPSELNQEIPLFDNTIIDLKLSATKAEEQDTVVSIIRGQGVEYGPKSRPLQPRHRKLSSDRLMVLILSLIGLITSIIVGFNLLYPQLLLPKVVGITKQQAVTMLEQLGFQTRISEQYNYTHEAGVVIAQEPSENTELRKGNRVNLTISIGKELMVVPDLTGRSLAEIKPEIYDLGLVLEVLENYHDTIPTGSIISQSVKGGEKLEKTGTLQIVVSLGMSQWSEWLKTLPDNIIEERYHIEEKTQYSFRDKEFTTSNTALKGWMKYKVSYIWGDWSPWTVTEVSATANREVSTRQVANPLQYKTVHKYERWMYINTSDVWASSYAQYTGTYYKSSGRWERITLDTKLTVKGTVDGKSHYGTYCFGPSNCSMSNYWWKYTTAQQALPQTYHTEYQYRDKQFTYYYYRWVAWSIWMDEVFKETANRDVKTQKMYRHRVK